MPDIEQTIFGDTLFMTEDFYGEKFDLAKEDLVGSKLNGRYKILKKLGEGGLGIVFLVQDLHRSEEVFYCVKILKNSEYSDLLEKEVKKLEILENENIVDVINFNKSISGEPPFILMEYIEGETLEQYLMEHIKLEEKNAEQIFLRIAYAMEYAHSKEIIHRDLKSENIMLTKDDNIKILDFGVAQLLNEDDQKFAGTLKYMSPEQLRNEPLNFTTDIYSYGIMLYEALSGEVPFAYGEVKYRILNEEPEKIEGISFKYWDIISKCLKKKPENRFRNFTELIFEFKLSTFIQETIIPRLSADILTEEGEKELYALGRKQEFTENQIKKAINKALTLTNTKTLFSSHISEAIEKIEAYTNEIKGRTNEEKYTLLYSQLEDMYVGIDPEDIERYLKESVEKFKTNLKELTETTYSEAVKLYSKKEFAKSAELLKILVDEGAPEAEVKLAYMYKQGIFFDKNIEKAIELLKSAALLEYLPALNELGNIYKSQENYEMSIDWYKKAAELGYSPAQNNLGTIYRTGTGVKQNYKEALSWYRKSAASENDAAQNNLGYMYKNGLGVKENPKEAVKWYKKAANLNNSSAQVNLAYMYRNGLGVVKDLAKSVEWYEKSAIAGNINAMNNLGVAYQKGEGIEQNYELALEWYEKSANAGYIPAKNNLGNIYELGLGTIQDYEKAFNFYREASEADYTPAHNNLARMYEQGLGVNQDFEIAMELYEKAAEQGSDKALYNIGMLYYKDEGYAKDLKKALKWFNEAVNAGNMEACYKIGEMRFDGEGVEQNYPLAFNWFEQAAEAGVKKAQIKMAELYKNGYGVHKNLDKAQRWLDLAGVTENPEILELNDISETIPEDLEE